MTDSFSREEVAEILDQVMEAILSGLYQEFSVADKEKQKCFRTCSPDFSKANAYANGIHASIKVVEDIEKRLREGPFYANQTNLR